LEYRNRRPSGRNQGQLTRISPRARSGVMSVAGVPPRVDKDEIASPSTDANRISPSAPQVPVSPMLSGTSQSGTAAPSGRSRRLSLLPAKNAIDFPSGDQKKENAPSVPASG